MDFEALSEIIRMLEGTRIVEFEFQDENSGRLLRLRRALPPAARTAVDALRSPVEPADSIPRRTPVEAHFVGRFHFSTPTIKAGDRVEMEQILGSIESMRLMNPVISPVNGVVASIEVEEGEPVEYGQPLFEIEPV